MQKSFEKCGKMCFSVLKEAELESMERSVMQDSIDLKTSPVGLKRRSSGGKNLANERIWRTFLFGLCLF